MPGLGNPFGGVGGANAAFPAPGLSSFVQAQQPASNDAPNPTPANSPTAGFNPFSAFGGAAPGFMPLMPGFPGAPAPAAAPTNTRPPEERYQLQLQVCHECRLWQLKTCVVHLIFLAAITRHGLRKCYAECSRIIGHRRECARGYRVHPWRRRLIDSLCSWLKGKTAASIFQ